MALGTKLDVTDYVVFALGIFASMSMGMYYAYKDRNKLSSYHFHRGGGKLNAFPVAMSMLVTFESSIFYLGYPAEVYVNGFIFWLFNFGMAIGMATVFWVTIPLFYPLQVTSVYEYLQLRHDSLVIRQVTMTMGALFMDLYAGIVLFGAAVALQPVTGISVWILIVSMAAIAVLYTSLGGIKAVVITDVVQGIIMIGMIFAVLIYGTMRIGSWQTVIDLNRSSGRLKLIDFDPNPLTRHTFWTLIVGGATRLLGFAFRQPSIQRFNSTKSIKEAKKVAAISIPGFIILQLLVMAEGLVAYAYFADKGCDPLAAGQISNPNQIMTFAVMDMFENVPGVLGLFLAALCSASLSTISSLLSSMSAILSEDIIRTKWTTMSEERLTKASKVIVLFCGIVCALTGLFISQVKGPLPQITGSIMGAIDGPVTAIFIMSIFIKSTTRRGLLCGTAVGALFALWISVGFNFSPGRKVTPGLPPGPIHNCLNNSVDEVMLLNHSALETSSEMGHIRFNNSITVSTTSYIGNASEDGELKGLNYLYSVSYMYISVMVSIVSLTVAMIISKFTKLDRKSPIPSYLMLSLNKRCLMCQPNYSQVQELTIPIEELSGKVY